MRRRLSVLIVAVVCCASLSLAQTPTAVVNGQVRDTSGAAIPSATVVIINDATGIRINTETNAEGIYSVPNLAPGTYRIQVSKQGFKTIVHPDIVLHIQDAEAIGFTLPVGSASDTVTVEGGAPLINTESAAVSTVIDRQFVENLPLNGRSFNTLLQLTPGVVIAQQGPNFATGQFSMAGQRTSANNFEVDGVSANFGVSPLQGITGSGTGSLQAFSSLGGTSSLVSVEALQEFRVETSSFAPEFGRSPGGQVILNTRSGTNDFHGGVYEYFRNDVMDANNWFANQAGLPRAPERHNDFGGFLGGRIWKDKTFFFLSYEGARLRQPNTMTAQVPSACARATSPTCPSGNQSASAVIAPYLNAYPQPNGPAPTDPCASQTPDGCVQQFSGSFSNPSTLNAGSVRIDHSFNSRFSAFVRYNEAPSQGAVRNNSLSEVDTTEINTRTLTAGVTMLLNSRVSNSLRGNYSTQNSSLVFSLDSFGAAVPPNASIFAPSPLNASQTYISFDTFDTGVYQIGPDAKNRTTQLNFADDLSVTRGAHQLKFGVDYRDIFLDAQPFRTFADYFATSVSSLISSGQISLFGVSTLRSQYLFQATSLYGQDAWRINPRVTLTYGLRWELSPAPSARGGTTLAAWRNVDTPSEIALAPAGSPLWSTTYSNFAPRVGVAYSLTAKGDFVLRAGWGLFYDLASNSVGSLGTAFPNDEFLFTPTVSLPISSPAQYFPVLSTQPPFSGGVVGFSPNLSLPRSYQWNVALEKSFVGRQALSLTYVGQAGRDLLRQEGLSQPNSNFAPFTNFLLTKNNARSNYNALQVQYRRPFANGLQILANYTYSHSLDNASDDTITAVSNTVISTANDYASSSFDTRHTFSGALTYGVPSAMKSGPASVLTRDWSLDAVIVARTGFPFNASVETASIAGAPPRPDLVAGQPFWIANPTAGGGKSLNPAAFSVPTTLRQGTEGRNDILGFGLTQVDLSVGRKFPIAEHLNLQFRADAFNAFNHPNFANPLAFIGFGPAFLKSRSMLNQGLGGLNPLFQEGGPRSLQLSLRLNF